MKPRATRSVNGPNRAKSLSAKLLAAGSCIAILSACADSSPLNVGSVPYAGDVEPSSVRPASPDEFPTLSNVPARPDDLPSLAERRALRESLEADLAEGQQIGTLSEPSVAQDLADVAAERSTANRTVVAEAVSPEPIGSEEPGQVLARAGEGPAILDAQGVAENTRALETEQLAPPSETVVAQAAEPVVAAEAVAEAAGEPRRGFFARLFGLGDDEAADGEESSEGTIVAVVPDPPAASQIAETDREPTIVSNGELLIPQDEEPAPAPEQTVVAASNGDLMIPEGEEPAPVEPAPVAVAVNSNGDLMIPEGEEPAPVEAAPTAVAVNSNGELMIPEGAEPAPVEPAPVAVAVNSNGDLMIPEGEEPAPVQAAPTTVAVNSNGELMVPQGEEPAPVVSETAVVAAASDGDLMIPQGEEPAAPAPTQVAVASNGELMLPQSEEPIPLPASRPLLASNGDLMVPEAEEPSLQLAEVEPEPVAIEPVVAEVAVEEAVEDKEPGFFARIFGGQGRRGGEQVAEDTVVAEVVEAPGVAEPAPAWQPVDRVVLAEISSNDPDLAPVAEPVVRTSAPIAVAEAPIEQTQPSYNDPLTQEQARALIAARERREAGSTIVASAPDVIERAPLVPVQEIDPQPSQVAALPAVDTAPAAPNPAPVTGNTGDVSLSIAAGPIDPTIRIFQERFAQSGVSIELPAPVAAIPAGSLTTDMPPSLPRSGIIYFNAGEMGVSQNQIAIARAAAADHYRAGGNVRLVAHRNIVGMPGDPDPADAARRRVQAVFDSLTASGVASGAIVTEIATANQFSADMDYNRRVEIYLDSATAAR